jgi:hypothetical protein
MLSRDLFFLNLLLLRHNLLDLAYDFRGLEKIE